MKYNTIAVEDLPEVKMERDSSLLKSWQIIRYLKNNTRDDRR